MPNYTVYRSRLLAIPGTRRELRIPGQPPAVHEDYRVVMEPVDRFKAADAETALARAKARKHVAPIVGLSEEELQ